jgi:nucleoid DNA-binding protein
MTKAEIIRKLSDQIGLTRREAAEVLTVVLDGVVDATGREG